MPLFTLECDDSSQWILTTECDELAEKIAKF